MNKQEPAITQNDRLKCTKGEVSPSLQPSEPSFATPSPRGTQQSCLPPKTPKRISKTKRNYEELKSFIPQNGNEENYALLSHYLMMDKGEAKSKKRSELETQFGFTPKNLNDAEKFFSTKNITFRHKEKPSFTFIDLFAGIGGFRLAMQANGGECVFSSEWDDAAKQTYYENYGEVPFGDITKDETKALIPEEFTILCGGFPCQPFSSIGKREGFEHKTQGTLFFHIAEILNKKRPKAFLLENVTGLLTHNEGKTFETIIDVLQNELHYSVFTKILNSSDYKVPQERKRLYFVGFRDDLHIDNFEFPPICNIKVGIGQFVEKNAIGPSISKHLQSTYIFKKDDGHPEIIDENYNFPVKTLCASYHKIQRITGTFVRGGETGLRLLTVNECKAIQGFPQDFKVPVSRTQMYHQFGNSVAVPVVTAIAKSIIEILNNKGVN